MSARHIGRGGEVVEFSREAGSAFRRQSYIARVTRSDDTIVLVTLPNGAARRPEAEWVDKVVAAAKDAAPFSEVLL